MIKDKATSKQFKLKNSIFRFNNERNLRTKKINRKKKNVSKAIEFTITQKIVVN